MLELWELIKEFAKWAGWFPITAGTIFAMVLGKYYYGKEILLKDQEMQKLKSEAKQYQVDVLVQHLSKKVEEYEKILKGFDNDKGTDLQRVNVIKKEKEIISNQLEIARLEINKLKSNLDSGIPIKRMSPDKLAELLKDEYIMLQKAYEDMDGKGLTIKNWAITVAVAIIGTSVLKDQKNLLWLAFAASFVFWYLEAYWRGLSHFFAVRIRDIEWAMQNGIWEQELPLQVYSTWSKEYSRSGDQTFRYMFKRASFLPHVLIPIFILIIYFIF